MTRTAAHLKPDRSLFRTLVRPLLIVCALAILGGTALSVRVAQIEYDELLDLSISDTANLLFALTDGRADAAAMLDLQTFINAGPAHDDEAASFWLIGEDGAILWQSTHSPSSVIRPPDLINGYETVGEHRFFVTAPGPRGRRMVIAAPLDERNEAIRDTALGILVSMIVLVILVFLVMRRTIGHVRNDVIRLSGEIASKDETDLAPIDQRGTFDELRPAIETLNGLMARLDSAVEAERSFATNAAHELRTPLAVSLAHTQRLRAAAPTPDIAARATEIEGGLKRLIHLVERLLQFSRAQSGLGKAATATDVNVVIRLMLEEATTRAPKTTRIIAHPPTGQFPGTIDPDALAILMSNLIDNAIKYSSSDLPIEIDATLPGRIVISNDCAAVPPGDLARITERYVRRSELMKGYGIGLAIVKTICAQSGATVTFHSPRAGSDRGFSADVTLPE